ncbi:hypothetical protein FFI94_027930 [Rhodococcus sp. KBS0724]|jgi:hypothetical protein|uniref:hypothetical protein n=1 Tax=Rhodococcus sp. KBS0724 TaxID=1179674 RepID=UPI00110F649A|nr:hypothetical protein [Rhodococcus sp. KBS0724]TSD49593.1 hypothetical protein FFI94_027930 [Rhodococcus sp. KBS0724]
MTLQKLTCEMCDRCVLVEKFSTAHTTIQWVDDANNCTFIAEAHRALGDNDRACPALRRSIDNAVRSQQLTESRIELPGVSSVSRQQ